MKIGKVLTVLTLATAPAFAGSTFENDCKYNFGFEPGTEAMEKCVAAYEKQEAQAKEYVANPQPTEAEYMRAILMEQQRQSSKSQSGTACVFINAVMVCP